METKETVLGWSPHRNLAIGLLLFFSALLFLYFPILKKLVYDWWIDPNYSHGPLLLGFSFYLVWLKRKELGHLLEKSRPSWWGFLLVLGGLSLLLLGWIAGELFTQRISFLIVLYGGLVFLLGWPLSRQLLFPVVLLILAIPIPYVIYNSLTFPMKLLATKIAVTVLQTFGLPVFREGNIIVLPNTTLEVVEACSGIRSLISLLAICSILAYFVPRPLGKVILLLATIPVAIGVNALRVFITAILAYKWGSKATEGTLHTVEGLLVFGLSLGLILIIYQLVKKR